MKLKSESQSDSQTQAGESLRRFGFNTFRAGTLRNQFEMGSKWVK